MFLESNEKFPGIFPSIIANFGDIYYLNITQCTSENGLLLLRADIVP